MSTGLDTATLRAHARPSMRAWWAYWLSLAIAVAVWIAAFVFAPGGDVRAVLSDPLVLFVLLAPLAAAGVNLIVFRKRHEEVCAIEAQRHAWLRAMVGNGYSATAFAITGVALLAFVGWVFATAIL